MHPLPTLKRRYRRLGFALFCLCLSLLIAPGRSAAQTVTNNTGFALNRYEPTTAGEWSLFVDHPWYSATRYFAAGVTVNYAHNPLVLGFRDLFGNFSGATAVVAQQLIGHVDLAGSFLDRILLSASLPITFLERGIDGKAGIYLVGGGGGGPQAPPPSIGVGDLRLGIKARLFGQPYAGALSLSLGVDVWVPINSLGSPPPFPLHVGESGVRVMPKLMLGGLSRSMMWSFTAGFLYRPEASLGSLPPGSGNTVGSELQLGAAVAYASLPLHLAIGPEAVLSTVVTGGYRGTKESTSLELLVGFHYNVARILQLSLGGGVGLLREPGTPDGRALLRLAYAPLRKEAPKDRDHDGILDPRDACPDEAGVASSDPAKNGCPPPDSDGDDIIDAEDECPEEPAGDHPDEAKRGCPLRDKDKDGVFDPKDECPEEPAGDHPDEAKRGCPLRDKDGDGVFDPKDQCPDIAAGAHPDPQKPGCPDQDSDGDAVFDGQDQCKDVPAGMFPDDKKPGCPQADRDGDFVPDGVDACPDQKGAPSVDAKKNGCPGLVEVRSGQIVILRQIFFAKNKDKIEKKSFPILDAVVATLKTMPQVKKVAVEGHTDNKGKPERNRELSEQRAKSVVAYLVAHGVEASRLEAHGYGPDRPIADNKTGKGRELNRRTDFRILDPAAPASQPKAEPSAAPPPKDAATAPAAGPDEKSAPGKPAKKAKKGKKAKKAKKAGAS
jgi:outer membrane protein OmpA-like peptidoglycan-associated protein